MLFIYLLISLSLDFNSTFALSFLIFYLIDLDAFLLLNA